MANRSQLEAESFTTILARFTFWLAFCLFCLTSAENYNADYEYEDYDDYEPLYDGNDYVDLDPVIDDYYGVEHVQSRSKKDVDPMLDMGWLNKSVVNLAEPVCEPVTNTTVASVTETTTECEPGTSDNPTTTTTATSTTATAVCTTAAAYSDSTTTCEPELPKSTTTSEPEKASLVDAVMNSELHKKSSNLPSAFQAPQVNHGQEEKSKELRQLVQRLYIAQAGVQLEASEIKKAQAIANEAQQQLEESVNHVSAVTAALQNAQQEVASSAIRARTAQLQLAAHDQLLFAARQDVDALSSQMVGLQAAEGIAQPKAAFDRGALMEKLRQPLLEAERPTPVPTIAQNSPLTKKKSPSDFYYDDEYLDY